jgi:co-chaperonin GroES (HSP10)
MKIRPAGHYALVEVEPVEETTESGIVYRTQNEIEREHGGRDIGRVVAFGPLAYKGFAHAESPEDWGVAIGDKVEFRRYDGKESRWAEYDESLKNLRYINDNDIIGVIEDD